MKKDSQKKEIQRFPTSFRLGQDSQKRKIQKQRQRPEMAVRGIGLFIVFLFSLSFLIILINNASGAISSGPVQSSGSAFSSYDYQRYEPRFQDIYRNFGIDYSKFWPQLGEREMCYARQDFILEILPGDCSPSVVRSDLLESQNVPVFCRITAVKINPLIKINEIKSVSFSQTKGAREIAGISFHPARVALRSRKNIFEDTYGNSLLNNLGYVVVVLSQQQNESGMPDFVKANLTAHIKYDIKKAFGSGQTEFYLQILDSEEEWQRDYRDYGFFKGRAYLRLDEIGLNGQSARVSVYQDADEVLSSVSLRKGKLSEIIYLPGFYCNAGVRLRLLGTTIPKKKVKIQAGEDVYWLYEGGRFLDNRCSVGSIKTKIENKTNKTIVSVSCPRGRFNLELSDNSEGGTRDLLFEDLAKKRNYNEGALRKFKDNFIQAKKAALELAELYPQEKTKDTGGDFYALDALEKAAKLAYNSEQFSTAKELYEKIASKYPDTSYARDAEEKLEKFIAYNYSNSIATTVINYGPYTIRLLDVKFPGLKDASADFFINGQEVRKGIDDIITGDIERAYIKLKDLLPDKIILEARLKFGRDGSYKTKTYELAEGESLSSISGIVLGGNYLDNAKLVQINLKREARIQVLPEIPFAGSSANFTFKVGIEKRAIKISPEKTKEMIKNINKSIKKFENINNNLASTVKAWKGACFAGSAALMVKNFISNLGGEASARREVMRGPGGLGGGWIDKCKDIMNENPDKYLRLDDCLYDYNDKIEATVNAWAEAQNKYDEELEKYLEANPDNPEKAKQEFIEKVFLKKLKSLDDNENKIVINGREVSVYGNESSIFRNDESVFGAISVAQAREILTAWDVSKAKDTGGYGTEHLQTDFSDIYASYKTTASSYRGLMKHNIADVGYGRKISAPIEIVKDGDYNGLDAGEYIFYPVPSKAAFSSGVIDSIENKNVFRKIIAVPASSNDEVVSSINGRGIKILEEQNGKLVANGNVSWDDFDKIKSAMGISDIIIVSKSDCSNTYLNPRLKYFSTGRFKGLPAVIPLDARKGWYVGIKDGGMTPYTEAGQVKSFWLCNVGKNGKEEFDNPVSDDKYSCIQINLDTGQPLDQSSCLNKEETRAYIKRAQVAIKNAGEYSQDKKGRMNFPGFGWLTVETIAASAPGTQCQDFMSPEDCHWLFNLCDPVLCPTSRCDLGGRYRVDDVVQSGIIGSIALCLPNIKEPIYMPVCLTGINAGLEAYLSVLRAHRDCLQESLESGQSIGICDEIKSVYTCELFWRNLMPLMKAGIPNVISGVFGQGTKGGGEYNNLGQAWDNLENSMSFFTQQYAVNSFKAFQLRSTEDIGSEMCKMFVSARYPSSGEFFDNLLEPESPTQFYAEFDEIPYSEATVPSTSQYNVFFHIYAGRERGVYYTVYIADPPESSFYASQQRVVVKQGFIASGDYASERVEFTAPAGYKQLCVRINNKDECGFQKVSTNFALNKLSEIYASEQAKEQEIKTEKECVAGTRSFGSLINADLNIGEFAQDVYEPSLYKKGIIRVCSGSNPGHGTDPKEKTDEARWKKVGYCDEAQKIGCWLDTESVKEVIRDKQLESETISSIKTKIDETLYNAQDVDEALTNYEGNPSEVRLDELNILYDKAPTSNLAARALKIKFNFYYDSAVRNLNNDTRPEDGTTPVEQSK